MSRQIMIPEIISKLSQLGVGCVTGQGADISITCEFLDAGWGAGDKKISYEASAIFDESSQTVFMWEMTKESGAGFSFGGSGESSFQSGTTLFRKVKSVQYGPDGKAYEYNLDLGAIPKAFKEVARQYGWKFKTVLKRDKASYADGYRPQQNGCTQSPPQQQYNPQGAYNAQSMRNKPKGRTRLVFWVMLIFLLMFDVLLYAGGSGVLFLVLAVVILVFMFALRKSISKGFFRTIFSFAAALVATFIIFAFTGMGDGNEARLSFGEEGTGTLGGFQLSIGSKDKPDIEAKGFARSVEAETLKPLEIIKTFKPEDQFIYYAVLAKYIPENSAIISKWYYEGKLVIETEPELMVKEVNNQYYTIHLEKGANPFPVGKYSVEFIIIKDGKEIFKCGDDFTIE
ncbi:MAG: hypothetical protein ABFD25_19960 [Clostridiaceae bacterium]